MFVDRSESEDYYEEVSYIMDEMQDMYDNGEL